MLPDNVRECWLQTNRNEAEIAQTKFYDSGPIWQAIKGLLGIADEGVVSFELRLAVDEVATVKITRHVQVDKDFSEVVQMYRLEPICEEKT